ncbi:TIR domain-containing protein [Gimesia algae]|uniref:TIR domain-containing protein n=1 Tax=Gimesia algae TaxID=2527971 RepID=A0A517VME0_9PLAN|nr:TIR domain-containing protein [Gimesia algae]QDT94178.1 hypothetical protein Pan161_58710 [Gimesia algae]
MKTKVFLSWGGATSRDIAKETKRWMESVIQAVDPFYSDRNIESGSYFPAELIKPLEATNIGVLCLTKECLNNKWVHFETGNLFKGDTKSRVHTLLFGLESSQVESPLSFFQHKNFEKQKFKEFMEVINEDTGELKLDPNRFNEYFDREWPLYEENINNILKQDSGSCDIKPRPQSDMIEEILELVRSTQRNISAEKYEQRYKYLVAQLLFLVNKMGKHVPRDIGPDFLNAYYGLLSRVRTEQSFINKDNYVVLDKLVKDFPSLEMQILLEEQLEKDLETKELEKLNDESSA